MDCSAIEFETPAKMALSVAMSATPGSTGKEILQRFRQLVAQKSAEKNSQSPLNGNGTKMQQSAASQLTKELRDSAKNKSGITIFKDVSAEKKKIVSSGSVESQSVKSRMKQSIAQRRTALKSRNVNIPTEDTHGGRASGLKKKSLGSTLKSEKQNEASTTVVEAMKSPVQAEQEEEIDEEMTSIAKENISLCGSVSLDLDISVSSEVLDSMERSCRTAESPMSQSESEEELVQRQPEQGNAHGAILETLAEEVEEEEEDQYHDNDNEEWNQNYADIERYNDELISIAHSCESVHSKSSSQVELEDHQSPKSNSVSEGSSLTPANSIQTDRKSVV